ncbi:DISARM system helicase DrmA [Kytococcus sedentarius]|uniref:DISARM system helicase DrmA n=1 Tax=Kytococcus sedentarius TaxID=1276 RepID=UPI00194DE9EE|nr:DISARM system helicase DrmA [Kytococcus sedentarius]QRO87011.1 helicase [Kytococcus sedentarius]
MTEEKRTALAPVEYDLRHEPETGEWSSWWVRRNLVDMLQRELVGPAGGPQEILDSNPKEAYLIGRIAPWKLLTTRAVAEDAPVGDEDHDDDVQGVPSVAADDSTVSSEEDEVDDRPQQRGLMIPASMGMRFQLPADQEQVTVTCRWARYVPSVVSREDERTTYEYLRQPVEKATTVVVDDLVEGQTADYPLEAEVTLRVDRYRAPDGRGVLLDVALCNDKQTEAPIPVDAWLYQTEIAATAHGEAVFLPVRDLLESDAVEQYDAEVARLELQYRNRLEFAVGRTCSVTWEVGEGERRATEVRTTWLPTSETPQTAPRLVPGALLDMKELAQASPEQIRRGLTPLVSEYKAWLDEQEQQAQALPPNLRREAHEALREAREVLSQLAEGLEHVATDELARECFAFMNRVMADQRVHSQISAFRSADPDLSLDAAQEQVLSGPFPHSWRPFQLAFILMQLPALTDPTHERRSSEGLQSRVELLFFPTGGGKTEAYLGLAAYTFAVRRRQGVLTAEGGALDGTRGVAVLMRYTLRLLTSQQFQRATALVCAAEMVRREDPATWGSEPFRIGMWVGSAVSPKRFAEAKEELEEAKADRRTRLTTLQVRRCPWCGTEIQAKNLVSDKDTQRIHVYCGDARGRCPFSQGGTTAEGLPMLTVDEEIYRLVPDFLIATVDKFARLAREGEAAALFGHVSRFCERHGYVHPDTRGCAADRHNATEKLPAAQVRDTSALRPPDLIIQDELHLITGSLGTTVGLFEAGIDTLCTWSDDQGQRVAPMIVASTATVRNAAKQASNLYGRGVTVFPPQVLDVADTFFSVEVPASEEKPGRLYVGVSAAGERLTRAEVRLSTLLMGSAQLLMDRAGDAADPYMTLVGYFNATRELAGMARLMGDDVQTALSAGQKKKGIPPRHGLGMGELRIAELTSRASGADITTSLDEMGVPFEADLDQTAARRQRIAEQQKDPRPVRPYDVVLATSMLQVGVDVSRLGLMMVVGQPKNTAEYIQASSRVGRDANRPGLVVSLGNWARPRDLAHFEQFRHYHETFYSQVEALSVTPFSPTNIERGVDGLLVSAARVLQARRGRAGLSPEDGAARVEEAWDFLQELAERLVHRAARADGGGADQAMRQGLANKLGKWKDYHHRIGQQQRSLVYERVKDTATEAQLMMSAEEKRSMPAGHSDVPFVVPNSMREVQHEVNLLVRPQHPDIDPSGHPAWRFPAGQED